MSAQTTMSAKGQVVIPKDVRDSMGFTPGQTLDVLMTAGGVLIRPVAQKSGRSFKDITASIRAIVGKWEGPALTIEEMNEAIADGWRQSAQRSDCSSADR